MFIAAALWLNNTSAFIDTSAHDTRMIAHRGGHQTYVGTDLDRHTCMASPVHAADHGFIENTLPSMAAAFEFGADIVEIDVHLTPDNVFAVFHDWTLDCRTNGTGVTHDQTWSDLQKLDVGYKYPVDGTTFPLRGQGSQMPSLAQLVASTPAGKWLINFKSNDRAEGTAMAERLKDPVFKDQVWAFYGGWKPSWAAVKGTNIAAFDVGRIKDCAKGYIALGWSGYVPEPCRNTVMIIPQNYAPLVWGWPHKFTHRMAVHGTEVILVGPHDGFDHTRGIDDAGMLADVPDMFDGYIWTNRVEVVGPLMK